MPNELTSRSMLIGRGSLGVTEPLAFLKQRRGFVYEQFYNSDIPLLQCLKGWGEFLLIFRGPVWQGLSKSATSSGLRRAPALQCRTPSRHHLELQDRRGLYQLIEQPGHA
ncbi:hypothetical protein TNCV_4326751, partial [Trichonephila clavipes]